MELLHLYILIKNYYIFWHTTILLGKGYNHFIENEFLSEKINFFSAIEYISFESNIIVRHNFKELF